MFDDMPTVVIRNPPMGLYGFPCRYLSLTRLKTNPLHRLTEIGKVKHARVHRAVMVTLNSVSSLGFGLVASFRLHAAHPAFILNAFPR
jgi:hypothetical protein